MKKHIINIILFSSLSLSACMSFAQEQSEYLGRTKRYGKQALSHAKKYGTKAWETVRRHKGKIATAVFILGLLTAGGYLGRNVYNLKAKSIQAASTAEILLNTYPENQYNLIINTILVFTLISKFGIGSPSDLFDKYIENIQLKPSTSMSLVSKEDINVLENNKTKIINAINALQEENKKHTRARA